MGRGSSKISGGGGAGGGSSKKVSDVAENLKAGDVITPGLADKWTHHIGSDTIRGTVADYITIDSVKVGPKTVTITGHVDLSSSFSVGSDAWKAAKKKFKKVTKTVKRGTSFNFKP